MPKMVEGEYKGVKYAISQGAIEELKTNHGIDAIKEIERSVDIELSNKDKTNAPISTKSN